MKYKALQNYFDYEDGTCIAKGEIIEISNISKSLRDNSILVETNKGIILIEFLIYFCKKESFLRRIKIIIVNKFRQYVEQITRK